jgi:hypothetical protein
LLFLGTADYSHCCHTSITKDTELYQAEDTNFRSVKAILIKSTVIKKQKEGEGKHT